MAPFLNAYDTLLYRISFNILIIFINNKAEFWEALDFENDPEKIDIYEPRKTTWKEGSFSSSYQTIPLSVGYTFE